jgi:uncharacterized membrane protein YkvA (DUF1232 family)
MGTTGWLLVTGAAVVASYLVFIAVLCLIGRRTDARALAGFVPDCVVLFRRLLGDRRVPRRSKALLGVAALYLALPIDLVPDFIPVAGQLDDALLVALVLRLMLRGRTHLIHEHWPGPEPSLRVMLRLAGHRVAPM